VPTLDEVLAAFPSTPLLVEIKTASASDAVKRVIERHGAADRCVVDAFDAGALGPFRGSPIAVGAAQSDVALLLAAAVARLPVRAVRYRALCVPRWFRGIPLPVLRFATMLGPLSCPVHVWTVNDPAEARLLWQGGVHGIMIRAGCWRCVPSSTGNPVDVGSVLDCAARGPCVDLPRVALE
jgi:glycerophosphoryl diester phosphodiesterase